MKSCLSFNWHVPATHHGRVRHCAQDCLRYLPPSATGQPSHQSVFSLECLRIHVQRQRPHLLASSSFVTRLSRAAMRLSAEALVAVCRLVRLSSSSSRARTWCSRTGGSRSRYKQEACQQGCVPAGVPQSQIELNLLLRHMNLVHAAGQAATGTDHRDSLKLLSLNVKRRTCWHIHMSKVSHYCLSPPHVSCCSSIYTC